MNDWRKCKKRNPGACRLHRASYLAYRVVRDKELAATAHVLRLSRHQRILSDLDKNLKLTVGKDGKKTVSVYRSGIASPPEFRGVENETYSYADSLLAEGQGRGNAVFAAPTLLSGLRWFKANTTMPNIEDTRLRELRVDPDEVKVYYIPTWEKASWSWDRTATDDAARKQQFSAYWEGGMTMTQWLEKVRNDPEMEPDEWELLLPKEKIKKVASVSPQRALASGNGDKSLERDLKRAAKAMVGTAI